MGLDPFFTFWLFLGLIRSISMQPGSEILIHIYSIPIFKSYHSTFNLTIFAMFFYLHVPEVSSSVGRGAQVNQLQDLNRVCIIVTYVTKAFFHFWKTIILIIYRQYNVWQLLSVSKFTANLYCICLSIYLRYT